MVGILSHAFGDGTFGIATDLVVVEKFKMLAPRNRDKRAEVKFFAEVEKPLRRHIIDPNQIDPSLGHQPEVAPGLLGCAEICPFSVGRERTIGHSFHKELLIALEEELRASAHPMVHGDTAREVDTACPAGKMNAGDDEDIAAKNRPADTSQIFESIAECALSLRRLLKNSRMSRASSLG